jgi:hypothetical protein
MSIASSCRGSRRLCAPLAALILLLALLAAPGARAAEMGVTPDLTWGLTHKAQDAQAGTLRRAGVRWVRLNVDWHKAEPRRGHLARAVMRSYDHAVATAFMHGLKIVMLVSNSPRWASGSGHRSAPPRDPRTYASFVGRLARRWHGLLPWYEVWNEENTSRFWPPHPDAGRYARLLSFTARAVHRADRRARVLFGGTAGNDVDFLNAVYRRGGRGAFDGMAVHPYSCSRPDKIVRQRDGKLDWHYFLGYRRVHQVMARHRDGRKPILITEFGWSTTTGHCGVSESTQADYLVRAFRLLARDRYVKAAMWYGWRDLYWEHSANTLEARYGLLRANRTPKASFAAFRTLATGRPGRVLVRTKRASSRSLVVSGRVPGGGSGRVVVRVSHNAGGRWSKPRAVHATVTPLGRFRRPLALAHGRWRLEVLYRPARILTAAMSKPVYVMLRPPRKR